MAVADQTPDRAAAFPFPERRPDPSCVEQPDGPWRLIGAAELAVLLSVDPETVRRMAHARKVPCYRLQLRGRVSFRFDVEAVLAALGRDQYAPPVRRKPRCDPPAGGRYDGLRVRPVERE